MMSMLLPALPPFRPFGVPGGDRAPGLPVS